jgi:type I restriction enzyme M protein
MLDNETKRRIDSARDILVGKVPDPKSQVEQITIALIYKFMDDMDRESVEMGGKSSFFTGEYQKYAWSKIFSPKLSGYEMLSLYADAITRMSQNPNIPQLFRDIFKNAFLPYRDPETLKLFLKTINDFSYDHSEKLGDAFEYLLSVLGSQGDAGQFRTPRHIIDFMVEIVDPQKTETILDPACGTAGFLISSYKYILSNNTSISSPDGEVAREAGRKGFPGDLLKPEERKSLLTNFKGFDISPDMVRLSLVNLYLHGFVQPQIYEYDTLTSEDRWNEYADVILANPPFMSPKGGIKPHKRFSVQSNRSEVLFVDYMAEHLFPSGRAAIVVPEGIIFQSGKAYKSLRKMLVDENYLVGVISLPAGVFNPYSGVKTCILWLDRTLAKKTDKILFVKISSDGFELGAQRRSTKENDLTDALININAYKHAVLRDSSFDLSDLANFSLVEKKIIAKNGEFSLSGERYSESTKTIPENAKISQLSDVAEIEYGFTETAADQGEVRFIRITDINERGQLKKEEVKYINLTEKSEKYLLHKGDILVARTGATFGKTLIFSEDYPAVFASYLIRIKFDKSKVDPMFYWAFAQTDFYWEQAKRLMTGGGQPQFNGGAIKEVKIPLPPLPIQQELVAEIESYQKIIDGARQVVENYKPRIDIEPEWEMVELGAICDKIQYGSSVPLNTQKLGYKTFRMNEIIGGAMIDNGSMKFTDMPKMNFEKLSLKPGDILFNRTNSFELVGKTGIFNLSGEYTFASYLIRLIINQGKAIPQYVNLVMNTDTFQTGIKQFASRAVGQSNINAKSLAAYRIPFPTLSTQQAIVARIEHEQDLVTTNRELVEVFEGRIKKIVEKVWRSEK